MCIQKQWKHEQVDLIYCMSFKLIEGMQVGVKDKSAALVGEWCGGEEELYEKVLT